MSKIYLIADLHFGHENIIKYEKRPFMNADEMNKVLINNWNQKVKKEDKVFVLGDVSFLDEEKTKEIVSSLNGYKILVLGNHDRDKNINWWYQVGFNEVYKYPIIFDEFIVMQHEPPTYYNDVTPFFYIYGHVHSTELYQTITKQSACVCVERWNYTPVDIEEIKRLVSKEK